MTTTAATARTWLFVPGDRPDRFDKAAAAGADEIICDLEDAVDADGKVASREQVARWLDAGGTAWVRVNAADTRWHDEDLAALVGTAGLRGVMLPKAEDPEVLTAVAARVGDRGLVALVESAVGMARAHELAAVASLTRLAFGSIDYAHDIGADHIDDALLLARSTLVQVSRAAGKPAPIDGVTTTFRDVEAVQAQARYGRQLGFGAKLCIHPAQVPAVENAYRPDADELAWARSVLAAAGGDGARSVDGEMVDRPVLERARRIVTAG